VADNIYTDGFIRLGEKYVDWYLAGKFELDQLVKFPSHLEALTEVYNVLARKRMLLRIEKLDLKDKEEIWKYCTEFIKPLSTPDRIRFCKCYWALSCLAQKRNV
jgi:hypothetical protein